MWDLVEYDNNLTTRFPERTTGKVSIFTPDNHLSVLLICSVFIIIPVILYTFRLFDNNRLLSWSWSISLQQLLVLISILSVILLSVAVLARENVTEKKALYLLPGMAFVISIPFWQQPEIIIDNTRYFTQAKYLELYGLVWFLREWGNTIFIWTDLPLVPLIYGFVFQAFGEHRVVIQAVNSLFLSGSVLITFLLGKQLWGYETGILAAIMLLGVPYIYNQVPLMLVDIPAMFFFSLALLITLMAVKQGGWFYFSAAAVAIVMAMLSKYSIWLMLSVLPMLLFFQGQGVGAKQILIRLMIIAAGVLSILALLLIWKYDVLSQQIVFLFEFQWNGLTRWQENNTSSFFFHIHPLITIIAIASCVTAIIKRDFRFLIVAWLPLLVIILEIKRMRYLIPVLPMIALMAAYGLSEVKNSYFKRFIAYGAGCSALVIALVFTTGFLQNTSSNNIKLAGAYLDSMDIQVAEVVVLPQQRSTVNPIISIPELDYYTSKTVIHRQDFSRFPLRIPPGANKSPVRFSWEYSLPSFYHDTGMVNTDEKAFVIVFSDRMQIDSKKIQILLKNYRLTESFIKSSGVFKYQTLVNIYEPI